MASRTQLRLAQLTGSLDDTQASAGSISETSLQGVLDHVASSIKRIHGGSGFQAQTAGHFNQNLHITGSGIDFNAASTLETAAGALTLKGASDLGLSAAANNDIIFQAGSTDVLTLGVTAAGDQTLITNIQDQDLVFQVNDGGSPTEVMRLDGDVSALAMASGKEIRFGGANTKISGDGSGLTIAGGVNGVSITGAGGLNTSGQATNITVIDNNANAFSFDASGQADILKIDSTDSAEKVVALKLDVTNDLSVGGDVTITGDLTVNGTTTTIDTTTLLIEDSFIGLATGSADSDAPQGFVFNRLNSNLGNTGKTNGVFFFDGAASSGLPLYKLGATDLKGDSTAEAITDVPDSDLGELRIAVLSISGSNNLLSLNTANDELVLESDSGVDIKLNSQNNMVLDSAGTIFIDADTEIQLKDGGVQYGTISGSASGNDIGLHLKSSAIGSNVFLNADSGQMIFQHGSNAPGLTIDVADVGGVVDAIFKDVNDSEIFRLDASATSLLMATSNKIQFRDADASLASATAAGELIYSGSSSFIVANTTTSNSGLLKIQKDDKYVGFDFDGDTSVTYSWPNAPAENGYVLQAQTDGTLAWAAQGGAANSSKVSQSIGATVTAGAAASSDAGFSAVDTQAIADATAPNALDVFVNGQLLVSSSVAYASLASSSDGDYAISSAGVNNTDLKFTFDLEADDVVTVIVRA